MFLSQNLLLMQSLQSKFTYSQIGTLRNLLRGLIVGLSDISVWLFNTIAANWCEYLFLCDIPHISRNSRPPTQEHMDYICNVGNVARQENVKELDYPDYPENVRLRQTHFRCYTAVGVLIASVRYAVLCPLILFRHNVRWCVLDGTRWDSLAQLVLLELISLA